MYNNSFGSKSLVKNKSTQIIEVCIFIGNSKNDDHVLPLQLH